MLPLKCECARLSGRKSFAHTDISVWSVSRRSLEPGVASNARTRIGKNYLFRPLDNPCTMDLSAGRTRQGGEAPGTGCFHFRISYSVLRALCSVLCSLFSRTQSVRLSSKHRSIVPALRSRVQSTEHGAQSTEHRARSTEYGVHRPIISPPTPHCAPLAGLPRRAPATQAATARELEPDPYPSGSTTTS